ncbi:hypothetical protein K2X33_14390 [bacterium]|nr:hypothetical protein [bacterium]
MYRKLLVFSILVCSSLLNAKTVKNAAPAMPASPAKSVADSDLPWKGKPSPVQFQFSGLAGLSIVGGVAGFGINAAAAIKVLNDGFIDDLNDQVFVEFWGGPVFTGTFTAAAIGAHLRWDLSKNDLWTFYGLAGLGGSFGAVRTLHVRTGLGVFWNLFEFLSFRGELSHEHIGVGVTYLL